MMIDVVIIFIKEYLDLDIPFLFYVAISGNNNQSIKTICCMNLIYFIISLLIQYFTIREFVKYTPLYLYNKYNWYNSLPEWIINFKGFNCDTCHTFWISMLISYNLSYYIGDVQLVIPVLLWANKELEVIKYLNENNNRWF